MNEFGFRNQGIETSFYRNNAIKEDELQKIISEEGLSKNGENITPIDLFFVPENLNSEEKDELIAKKLGFEKDELEKRLPEISYYWQEAKDFYRTYLIGETKTGPIFPKEIERRNLFESLDDLRNTLDKATRFKKGDRFGFGPFYCALFSLILAEREYEKEEFQGLTKEGAFVSDEMFRVSKDGTRHFSCINKEDENWLFVGVLNDEKSWMNAHFTYRGKMRNSVVCKLASKPEFSAKEIIKDGIGLKFEVANKEDAEKLFTFLIPYLEENFSAEKIIFENTKLFNDKEQEDLLKKFENKGIQAVFMENKNPSSNKNFRVAKIRGEMKVPKDGKEGNLIIARDFEAQVVLTDNENETGLVQNKIYKRIQKLSLFSRLFGAFNEAYLDLMVKEASEASGISERKIKKHIVDNYLLKVITRAKETKYVSRDQFERWQKAKILPPEIKVDERKRK